MAVDPIGVAVGLGTGLAFAVYSLAGKWSAKRFPSPWTVTAYGFLFAAGLIASLEPALTAIMAIFLLGEWLDAWQWLGAGLILVAVVLAQTEAEKRVSQPESHVPAEAKG